MNIYTIEISIKIWKIFLYIQFGKLQLLSKFENRIAIVCGVGFSLMIRFYPRTHFIIKKCSECAQTDKALGIKCRETVPTKLYRGNSPVSVILIKVGERK